MCVQTANIRKHEKSLSQLQLTFAFRSVYNSSNCLAASGVESSDDTALIGRGENLLVSVALHDREEAYALETVYYKNIVL